MPGTARGIPLDRIVAVVATLDGGREQVGSGYLVGGRIVLTAEHCTRDKLRAVDPPRPVQVFRASDGASAGVVAVDACPDLDVAVLHLADAAPWPAGLLAPGYARLDRQHAGMLVGCQVIGYPEWQRDPQKKARDHAELHGTINQTDLAESGHLLMREPLIHPGHTEAPEDDQHGAATPWGGLSGALVFYDGRAIGLVMEHHPRQGDSALTAIAFDTLARKAHTDPNAGQVAKALGLPAENAMLYVESSPVTPGGSASGDLPVRPRLRPPSPPGTAVLRSQLAAEVLSALRDGPSPLVALVGPGGFGKSVLALQIAAEIDAQAGSVDGEAWWPGGVVWLDVGQDPNLASLLSQRLADLTGVPGVGQSAEKLASDLGAALASQRCLLVLDDVWPARPVQADVVDIVISRIGDVPRLVTTRSAALLDVPGARSVEVPEMDPGEAADVLAAAVPGQVSEQDLVQVGEFARRLGYWPLLLHLAEGYLRRRVRGGVALRQALAELAGRYERKGVTAFDARDPAKRDDAVAATMEASLGMLSSEDQARYRDLAVFPPGQPVPFDVIAGWWAPALDRDDTEDLLTSLAEYALLTVDWKTETIRLHEVLGAYLLARDLGQVAALHRRLVGNWGDPLEQDRYRTRWYAYHLDLADESDRLYALITPAWRDHVLAVTGALSDVQTDVLRAADCARQQRNLPQELRCRLIATSLATQARALPGPLLRLLARLGEVDRALGYAMLLTPRYSSLALKDIAEALARSDPERALIVADRIEDPMHRGMARASIATALAETNRDRALTIADRVDAHWAKAEVADAGDAALAGVDPEQMLTVAVHMNNPRAKARALSTVAITLAEIDSGHARGLLDQAVAASQSIADPAAKAQVLSDIGVAVARSDPSRFRELSDEALAAADAIDDEVVRARVLGSLAVGQAGIDLDWALAIAERLDDPTEKIAVVGTKEIRVLSGDKVRLLADITATLADADPPRALAVASQIDDSWFKAQAIAQVGIALVDADRGRSQQLAEQALATAIGIPWGLGEVLGAFAAALVGTDLDLALATAGLIQSAEDKDRALAAIAAAVASADPGRATSITDRISNPVVKTDALANIAVALARTNPEQAIAAAEQLDSGNQGLALAGIAAELADTDIVLALTVADSIDSHLNKAQALAAIAAALAAADPSQASSLAGDAVDTASHIDIDDADDRAWLLVGIAIALAPADPGRASSLVRQALAVAGQIGDAEEKARSLVGITNALASHAPTLIGEVADAADHLAIDDFGLNALTLASIGAALAATDPSRASKLGVEALDAADHLDDYVYKAQVLTAMADPLASINPGHTARLISRLIDAANDIPYPAYRESTLAGIAAALVDINPDLALTLIGHIDDIERKARGLACVAAALAGPSPGRARELADQAVATAVQGGAGFTTWHLLKEMAAMLSRQDSGLALIVADVIGDPEYKASALAEVAEVQAGLASSPNAAAEPQPGTHFADDLLAALRAMAPQTGREAWWRFAQLAVVLAATAQERHDLVKAVLDTKW